MRRGSVNTYISNEQELAKQMAYLSGCSTEFITDDVLEHHRGGGCFVTYGKAASVAVVFVIALILAGFVGAYTATSSSDKYLHDIETLGTDEPEDEDTTARRSVLSFIYPTRYILELTPEIEDGTVTKMKGRAVIEFRLEGKSRLSELPLSARNITTTRYKLSLLNPEESEMRRRRRRRRRRDAEEQTGGFANNENSATGNGGANPGNDKSALRHVESFPPALTPPQSSGDKKSPMEIEVKQYEVDVMNELHVIYPVTEIGAGSYSLEIDYEVPVDDKAIYTANLGNSTERKWLLGTTLKPANARCLLPVFDDVRFKSLFSVSLARPAEMTVLANTPLRTSREVSKNWVMDTFDETPPMSINNLGFAIGPFESMYERTVDVIDVPVRIWADAERMKKDMYILDMVAVVLSNLFDTFRVSFPLPKLDVIPLPPERIIDTASLGLISLRDSMFYSANESSPSTKINTLKTLIRLLGEQWLGGMVNMNNWTDVWILEGSLLYLQHAITQKIDPSFESSQSFVADVQLAAMESDGYTTSKSLQAEVNPQLLDFSNTEDLYKKGACLIRMLHGTIGNTGFRNGYKKFITRWRNDTSNSTVFWDTMVEELDEYLSNVTLKEIVIPWISQNGYPVVTVTRNYEDGSATLRQEKFVYDQSDVKQLWHIPLTYVDETGDWSSPSTTWFDSEKETLLANVSTPGQSSWILFNVNKTGYYRVNYDEENWVLLGLAHRKDHTVFPPETRASLVDDVLSLAAVGLTEYDAAFGFIKYMQTKERHYAPWSALLHHMLKLNNILYSTSAYAAFLKLMLDFVSPLYDEVGQLQGSRLALIATQIACLSEHPRCLDWANRSFERMRQNDTEENAVPSDLREVLYCTIARYGGKEEWSYFLERTMIVVDREEKNRILSAFGCFQVPWLLQSIIDKAIYETAFTDDEVQVILRGFSKHPVAAQIVFRFMRANWKDILIRYSNSHLVMKHIIAATADGLISEQDLEDLHLFRENNYDTMNLVRHIAAAVEAKGNFATSWLEQSLPVIKLWLANVSAIYVS